MRPELTVLIRALILESGYTMVFTYLPGPPNVPEDEREVAALFFARDEPTMEQAALAVLTTKGGTPS